MYLCVCVCIGKCIWILRSHSHFYGVDCRVWKGEEIEWKRNELALVLDQRKHLSSYIHVCAPENISLFKSRINFYLFKNSVAFFRSHFYCFFLHLNGNDEKMKQKQQEKKKRKTIEEYKSQSRKIISEKERKKVIFFLKGEADFFPLFLSLYFINFLQLKAPVVQKC